MGRVILYRVPKSGEAFNSALPPSIAAQESDWTRIRHEEDDYEFKIPGYETWMAADLRGLVTVVWTPWLYSELISGAPRREMLAFEGFLRQACPTGGILRFDEMLRDDFIRECGEEWTTNRDLVEMFPKWLELQDHRYWAWLSSVE